MEKIYILCPADEAGYQHMLREVSPRLDDAGISFHICRPGENYAGLILKGKEVTK